MKPEAIKSFRKDRNLSQSELARELGVDQATVSRAENGGPLPRPAALLLQRLMDEAKAKAPEPEGRRMSRRRTSLMAAAS